MRPRPATSLSGLLLCLALSARPAAAGPVSEVARGVDNKVETHGESSGGASSGNEGAHDTSRDDSAYYDTTCFDCADGDVYVAGDGPDPIAGVVGGEARLDLYLGAHSVVGSQGAVVGEVRAYKGWLGISAASTSYFERIEDDKGRSDSVRLDLMAFALGARVFGGRAAELWIDGGMGASSSSEYETIIGTAFGLRSEVRVHPQLAMVGQGRLFSLEADVSAFEGWAGLRASFLSAGYRVVKFNVGPALHGPEAGISLRF
jgi:hypothetical protein